MVLKIAKEPISLETPVGEEEDSHLGDFIEDKTALSPAGARSINHEPRREHAQGAGDALAARGAGAEDALRDRRRTANHTLEEVGQDFEVTRERIRQIEAKALRKLRHPSRSRILKSFVD